MIPGEFQVTVILRNRVIQRYTVAERLLHVQALDNDGPMLTDPVLAFGQEVADPADGTLKAFRIGGVAVQPAADSLFAIGDTAYLLTQVSGASREHKLSFDLMEPSEQVIKSFETHLEGEKGIVIETLPLDGLTGGNYLLRTRLLSPGRRDRREDGASYPLARSFVTRPGSISSRLPRECPWDLGARTRGAALELGQSRRRQGCAGASRGPRTTPAPLSRGGSWPRSTSVSVSRIARSSFSCPGRMPSPRSTRSLPVWDSPTTRSRTTSPPCVI